MEKFIGIFGTRAINGVTTPKNLPMFLKNSSAKHRQTSAKHRQFIGRRQNSSAGGKIHRQAVKFIGRR